MPDQQTDQLSYAFTESNGFYTTKPIRLVLTNTSGAPAFLTNGGVLELTLEGWEDGEWVARYSKNASRGGAALALATDATATFETMIEGFLPGACQCRPIVGFADGIYRFSIFQGYVDSFDEGTSEPGNELPLEFRVSNSFTVDVP